jgi:hypothetical protein
MSAPSADHEARCELIMGLATLAGLTVPSAIGAGLIPDVVRRDARGLNLLVGDAKGYREPRVLGDCSATSAVLRCPVGREPLRHHHPCRVGCLGRFPLDGALLEPHTRKLLRTAPYPRRFPAPRRHGLGLDRRATNSTTRRVLCTGLDEEGTRRLMSRCAESAGFQADSGSAPERRPPGC